MFAVFLLLKTTFIPAFFYKFSNIHRFQLMPVMNNHDEILFSYFFAASVNILVVLVFHSQQFCYTKCLILQTVIGVVWLGFLTII